MKYCTKCGHELIDEARFCNACGAPAMVSAQTVNSENPYASAQPAYEAKPAPVTYTEKPKTEEELLAEEQALLDKFSLGLKHERLCWKVSGIVFTVMSAFFVFFGLIFGIATAGTINYSEGAYAFLSFCITYSMMGLMYLPIAIINMIMKKKIEDYRAKLYTDCRDGIGHYSVGSIVFAAFFNTIALVFIIIYFIQAKNNSAVIERIKARQDSYNSQS